LDIPDVKIEQVKRTVNQGFEITVSSTLKTGKCRQCGKETAHFYGYGNGVTLRHLPLFEMPVWIKHARNAISVLAVHIIRRVLKNAVGMTGKARIPRHEQWLLRDLLNSTITDVSMKRGIGEAVVEGILNRAISRQINWQTDSRDR